MISEENENKEFEEYLKLVLLDSDQLYYNYNGILKKDFPKWAGWKIINKYKQDGTNIKDIHDTELEILVRNFHYLEYIKIHICEY